MAAGGFSATRALSRAPGGASTCTTSSACLTVHRKTDNRGGRVCVDPLLDHLLPGGTPKATSGDAQPRSTLLLFGQTGTGKTYTLSGALGQSRSASPAMLRSDINAVKITFFELHGKKAYDLLADRAVVRLLADQNGVVRVRGAASMEIGGDPTPASRFRDVVGRALRHRAQRVTSTTPCHRGPTQSARLRSCPLGPTSSWSISRALSAIRDGGDDTCDAPGECRDQQSPCGAEGLLSRAPCPKEAAVQALHADPGSQAVL